MNIPKITVLMSVYNGEKFLKESIDSILTQTFEHFEFIIINDGSTDRSLDIIKSYKDSRIKLINNSVNVGLTKSLNYGLTVAIGEFIARQDSDDISYPTRFEKQIKYLNENKDIVLLGTQAKIIDSRGELKRIPIGWVKPLEQTEIKWICMFDSPFIHSSVMMRRKIIWDNYSGYDNNYRTSQDYELWSRVVYENKCENLNEQLISFRFTTNSISSNYSQESILKISDIMMNSISRGIGHTLEDNFLEQWVSIFISKYYNKEIRMSNLVSKIDYLYIQFCEFNSINNKNSAILKEKKYLILRISYLLIEVDKLLSVSIFIKSLRSDFLLTLNILPKYLLRLIFKILLQYKMMNKFISKKVSK